MPSVEDDLIRLHWNESPLGPPPAAVARIVAYAAEVHRYPVGLRTQATSAFAEHIGRPAEETLLTCGVDEAADLLLAQTGRMWHVVPGFRGYAERARALGVPVHPVHLDEDYHPLPLTDRIGLGDTVFVAQPHNPTANHFPEQWLKSVLDTGALLFLDETYAEFSTLPRPLGQLPEHPGLIRFHSLSKAWGLAGLRIGALTGPREVIVRAADRQRFQSVDSLALHGLLGALEEPDWVADHADHIRTLREEFRAVVEASAVFDTVLATQASFFVARCAPGHTAAEACRALLRQGVRVYDCAAVGMDGWLRISVGRGEDLPVLRDALAAVEKGDRA